MLQTQKNTKMTFTIVCLIVDCYAVLFCFKVQLTLGTIEYFISVPRFSLRS